MALRQSNRRESKQLWWDWRDSYSSRTTRLPLSLVHRKRLVHKKTEPPYNLIGRLSTQLIPPSSRPRHKTRSHAGPLLNLQAQTPYRRRTPGRYTYCEWRTQSRDWRPFRSTRHKPRSGPATPSDHGWICLGLRTRSHSRTTKPAESLCRKTSRPPRSFF